MKDRIDGFLIMGKTRAFFLKEGMKEKLKEIFCMEQEGIGVVEIILILVIIITIVVIFRGELEKLVNQIFAKIFLSSKDYRVEP